MILNKQNFLLTEIPNYHPLSLSYVDWWKEQKKRCIEGYWSGGRWMPGKLYFYTNFGTILLNKKASSKVKEFGRPLLRDLEWELFYNWEEARGFSGFLEDTEFTCARKALKPKELYSDVEWALFQDESPHAFTSTGQLKTYKPARDYLRMYHGKNLGRPLYENEAKDLMMMGSRGYGKSFSVGVGIVLHEWLFDGITEYVDPTTLSEEEKEKYKSEIVIGASSSGYAKDLTSKIEIAASKLPGGQMINGVYYPCPFNKQYEGSWSKEVFARYRKKEGSEWKMRGSNSSIKQRIFADNPFAANGTRPGVMVMEEIGFFGNLIESRNASVECQMNGAYKFGSTIFIGTGGDMEEGTIPSSIMFNDPESYNLLAFDDIWENTGKIGYFVPAYLGLNQYKDEDGNTDIPAARAYLEAHREKLRKSKTGAHSIDDELQNRPIIPSEIFLSKKGSDFPIDELRKRLVTLKQANATYLLEKPVTLVFDSSEPCGVKVKPDLEKKLKPLNHFPLPPDMQNQRDGAVCIYEYPIEINGKVPNDMYVIGYDPYNTDDETGKSLAAIYVLKTKKYKLRGEGHDEIVASFIGRPYEGRRVVNENLLKLSMLYGDAQIFFENTGGNTKEYFEKMKRLDLLCSKPAVLFQKTASFDQNASHTQYGYPMSDKKTKSEGVKYLRDWLLEVHSNITTADGETRTFRNLDRICDQGLLQELISFNYTGNFDRVMALIGCIIGLEETHNQYVPQKETKKDTLAFLRDNKAMFALSQNGFDEFATPITPRVEPPQKTDRGVLLIK